MKNKMILAGVCLGFAGLGYMVSKLYTKSKEDNNTINLQNDFNKVMDDMMSNSQRINQEAAEIAARFSENVRRVNEDAMRAQGMI